MAKWFHGEKTANASGRGGTVFVADVSASMDMATLLPALRAVKAEIAGARVIAFADTAVEVHILRESYIPGVGGGTVMSAGLMRAEEMRPDLTIVMSDGLTSDRAICFDIADRMSGKISAIFRASGRCGTAMLIRASGNIHARTGAPRWHFPALRPTYGRSAPHAQFARHRTRARGASPSR